MKQAVLAMMIAFLGGITLTALAALDSPYTLQVGNNNTVVQLELDQWGNIIKPRLSFVNEDAPAGYAYRLNIAKDVEGASVVASELLSAPPWLAGNIILDSDESYFWGIETLNASRVSEGQSVYREFIVSLSGEVSDDAITFLTEHQQVSESQQSVDIKWKNNVPYSGATLSLYAYDNLIAEGINLNDYEGQYPWQIADMAPGTYQVKGVVDDGTDQTEYNCCVITKLADERGISVVFTNGENTNEDSAQVVSVAINLTAPIDEGKSYDIEWKSNDISEALLTDEAGNAVASTSMSFNATNWSVVQTLYVTGISDCELDGDKSFSIVGESISTDTDYLWVQPRPIFLTNLEHSKVGQEPFICGYEVASSQVQNTSVTEHVVSAVILNSDQYSLGVKATLNGANEGVSVTGENNHSFGDVMPNTAAVSPHALTVTLANDVPVSNLALNWSVSLEGSTPPIEGTDNDDALNGTEQTDVIYAGAGNDVINAGSGHDVINAGSGNDVINAGNGDDFISIDHSDVLADTLDGGAGSDTLMGSELDDTWRFSDVKNIENILGHGGTNIILGTEQDDSLDFTNATLENISYIDGLEGNDNIIGGSSDDELRGNVGNDTLSGGSGNDILVGGIGDDRLAGNKGSDIYNVSNLDGLDTIVETFSVADNDTLQFIDSNSFSDWAFSLDRKNLIIKNVFYPELQVITIENWIVDYNAQISAQLADGTTENLNVLFDISGLIYGDDDNNFLTGTALEDLILGFGGNDNLTGGNGDDVLTGGYGNDILDGGIGNDRFLFSIGDGQDVINHYDTSGVATYTDTLVLGDGITLDDLIVIKSGSHLVIELVDSEDQVKFTNWFSNTRYQIDQFELAEGTVYSSSELLNGNSVLSDPSDGNDSLTGHEGIDNMTGGEGNDTLTAYAGNDFLNGGAGNDTLQGGDGDDQLLGGEGNDILHGDSGDDILTGGAGNDALIGGAGNDRFLFERGDGQDTVNQYDSSGANTYTDTLVFGENIILEGLKLVKLGNHLIIKLLSVDGGGKLSGNEEQIQFTNWFVNANYQVDEFEFSDGTVYTTTEFMSALSVYSEPTDGNDSLTGYTGVDIMSGGLGDDTLTAQAGNDSLDGGEGNDRLTAGDGNDQLIGGLGDDVLAGDTGDDVLTGGQGNDSLSGGAGNDRYLFGIGDGQDTLNTYDSSDASLYTDTLVLGEGITLADLTLVKSGDYLIIKLTGTEDQIKILYWFKYDTYKVDKIELADGSIYSAAEFMNALPVYSDPTDGNDSLVGYTGVDIMTGGLGNDSFTAGDGNDSLDGGEGNDSFLAGSGNDQLVGGNGDDTLKGEPGDDILIGGKGNDSLDGGSGNDRYLFGIGDGKDTLNTYDSSDLTAYTDTLVLGAGITLADLTLVKSGDYLIIKLTGTDDQIKILYWFKYDRYKVDQVELADGSVYSAADFMNTLPLYSESTDGNDTLTGYTGVDIMSGGLGDDTLTAHAGNDSLDGGEGNDRLIAGDGNDQLIGGLGDDVLAGDAGDDVLTGGQGNDSLNGGVGNDRYLFGIGDGQDSLNAYDSSDLTAYTDTLVLGEGITLADLTLVKSGDYLIIKLTGTQDQIKITYWFKYDRYQVDQIELADGNIYTPAEFISAFVVYSDFTGGNDSLSGYSGVDNMSGGAGDDVLRAYDGDDSLYGDEGNDNLYGGNHNDQLFGGMGDDRLEGDAGNDTIVGGVGNDYLYGGAGDDLYQFSIGDGQDVLYDYDSTGTTDILEFGEGITLASLNLARSGENLVIKITGTENQISITKWFYKDYYHVEQIKFFDGTVYTDSEFASALPILSEVFGGDGNDDLDGYYGVDDMRGGAGNDTLDGYEADDLLDGGDGNDRLRGDSGNDTLDGAEGNDTIDGDSGNDQLTGGAGDDDLDGGTGNDFLTGGPGNDKLEGGSGDDHYFYAVGDGQDTLRDYDSTGTTDILEFGEGITLAGLSLVRSGNNLIVKLTGTEDQISITNWFYADYYHVEQIKFFDGTVYTDSEFASALPILSEVFGGDGNDDLDGYYGVDDMRGGAGNDTLDGEGADDLLDGGDGNDRLSGDSGNDTLDGGEGNDTIDGDSGNDQLTGGAGDDDLDGGTGNDVLTGGPGNDKLEGGSGDDHYFYAVGDGQDVLYDYDSTGTTDILEFGEGITLAGLNLVRSGNNLIVKLTGTEDQISITNWFYADYYHVEQIKFFDGTVYTDSEFINALPVETL